MNKAMQFQTVLFYLYFFYIFLSSCNSKYFNNQGSEQSCDGRCWQDYNPNDVCHCNSQCQNFNNCCDDFENLCLTCENRCGLGYDNKYSCQCNTACDTHNDCCPDYNDICTDENSVSDDDLKTISNHLFELAIEKQVGIVLNLQGHTQMGSSQDNAPENLITKIDEESMQFGTYQKLIKLLDNYNPDVTVEETPTTEELQEEQEFLDEMFQTEIIQTSFNFLKSFNYVSDLEEYRNKIYKLWFELYDRDGTSKNVLGSSGFEHVFSGEIKNNEVSGFHGWVHYYMEEQADNLNYFGHINSIDFGSNMYGATIVYEWNGHKKPIGGGFFGTPPELDLALSTICVMIRAGTSCPMMFGNNLFNIKTFDQNGNIGSAYPEF